MAILHDVSSSGRPYPAHLRDFEAYDDALLHVLHDEGAATFDQLAERAAKPELQAVLARWLTSAQWRGLVRRAPGDATHLPTYFTTAQAEHAVRAA